MTGKRRKVLGLGCKGNAVLDTPWIFVILFVFALISFIGFMMFDQVKSDIMSGFSTPEANDTINETYNRYAPTFDSLLVVALVLFWIMGLGFSFMVDTHPFFFILSVIILAFVFIAIIILGNTYTEVTQDSEFGTLYTNFPMTSFIFDHILPVGLVVGFSIAFVLFFKIGGGG